MNGAGKGKSCRFSSYAPILAMKSKGRDLELDTIWIDTPFQYEGT